MYQLRNIAKRDQQFNLLDEKRKKEKREKKKREKKNRREIKERRKGWKRG